MKSILEITNNLWRLEDFSLVYLALYEIFHLILVQILKIKNATKHFEAQLLADSQRFIGLNISIHTIQPILSQWYHPNHDPVHNFCPRGSKLKLHQWSLHKLLYFRLKSDKFRFWHGVFNMRNGMILQTTQSDSLVGSGCGSRQDFFTSWTDVLVIAPDIVNSNRLSSDTLSLFAWGRR